MTTDDPLNNVPSARPPSLVDALIPIVALLVLLISAFVLFGNAALDGPNQVALLTCGLIAIAVGIKNHTTCRSTC